MLRLLRCSHVRIRMRSPRASPGRVKKKARGRHGGARKGSGRKFAHEAVPAACAAEAAKPGVVPLRAYMGMDTSKRRGAALRHVLLHLPPEDKAEREAKREAEEKAKRKAEDIR